MFRNFIILEPVSSCYHLNRCIYIVVIDAKVMMMQTKFNESLLIYFSMHIFVITLLDTVEQAISELLWNICVLNWSTGSSACLIKPMQKSVLVSFKIYHLKLLTILMCGECIITLFGWTAKSTYTYFIFCISSQYALSSLWLM